MRKTLFLQKKIKLLNVQFMVNIVVAQTADNLALEASLFSVLILKTMYSPVIMHNTRRAPTTNKQVEILFKFIVVLFSGDAAFLRRTFLEMMNNLKLKYIKGGNTTRITISMLRAFGMIMLSLEIMFKVVTPD